MRNIINNLETQWRLATYQMRLILKNRWICDDENLIPLINELVNRDEIILGVCGPGASGKSTFLTGLCQKYAFKQMLNTTTRLPRDNEINGQDYRFISEQEYSSFICNNEFVTYEQKSGRGNYGLLSKDVEYALQFNKVCVIESPLVLSQLFSDIESSYRDRYKFIIIYFLPSEPYIKNLTGFLESRDASISEEKIMIEHGWRQIEEFSSMIALQNDKKIESYVVQGMPIQKILEEIDGLYNNGHSL